ncbi:hypothetical protein HBB16_09360, partial [Pseudonocardia sp. MCCB 268]|nr:hypothetical protein [Pseudonocardia cytotoxica]
YVLLRLNRRLQTESTAPGLSNGIAPAGAVTSASRRGARQRSPRTVLRPRRRRTSTVASGSLQSTCRPS